jgi:hypothetical protein
MIQSNKLFRAYSGCWDLASSDYPKFSKKLILKNFFYQKFRVKMGVKNQNGGQNQVGRQA